MAAYNYCVKAAESSKSPSISSCLLRVWTITDRSTLSLIWSCNYNAVACIV